jgi:signal transduction histidine kinase
VRAFDGGKLDLSFLLASLVLGGILVFAELSGLDGLCPTRRDEAVFVVLVSLCSACLVLAQLARKSPLLKWPLAAGSLSCLAFALYFPLSPISALAFAMYVAMPLALYLPFPKGGMAAALALAALFAIRFALVPPEALGQRAASFRDILLLAVAPLFASSLVSALRAFRAEIDRIEDALLEVTRLNLSYQDYNASLEEKTALEERLRLTRDIHDVVGYALTNTIMTLRAASLMCEREPERVASFLDSARENAEAAHGQVRAILRDMRRREIKSAAGPNAIAKTVRSFKAATGAEVDLDFGNFDWSIGGDAALAASHFVMEGMLNAVSHGKATVIRVAFRETEAALTVSVKDNGAGAKALQEGIGIAGMRERIEKLGGSLDYSSSSLGFSIEMSIPVERRTE